MGLFPSSISNQVLTPPSVSSRARWRLATLFIYADIRYTLLYTVMMSSVVVSYAIQLQPLPPNTAMTLVADVAGTTTADDAFWAVKCKAIPSNTLFIVVDMGAVRDYFRPAEGGSFCEMMQSDRKHQWSYDGVDWVTPNYQVDNNNGGSFLDWPSNNGQTGEDKRSYLSFWGTNHDVSPRLTGGCCSTSTAVASTHPSLPGNGIHTNWGQPCTQNKIYHTGPHLPACVFRSLMRCYGSLPSYISNSVRTILSVLSRDGSYLPPCLFMLTCTLHYTRQ